MTTIQNLRFNNIQDNSPCINLDNWETKQNVIIEDSTFSKILNARCIMTTTETSTFQTIVRNCNFIDNSIRKSTRGEYLSGCGASILCQHQGNLVVTKCNFTNNMAEANGGAVYAETNAIELNMCRFELCSAAPYEEDGRGGAIYLNQTSTGDFEFSSGNVFINCSASYSGGGLYIYCRDVATKRKVRENDENEFEIIVSTCNFTNCSSGVEGGALSSGIFNEETKKPEGDNDLQVIGCYFTRCESAKGGALYFQDGTEEGDEETNINGCSFYECYASGKKHEGYAIHCRSYRMNIEACQFYDHKPPKSSRGSIGSIVFLETNEADVKPSISSLIFHGNHNIPSLVVRSMQPVSLENIIFSSSPLHITDEWDVSEITFVACKFQHNSGSKGGSVYISSSTSSGKLRRAKLLANTTFVFDQCQFINSTAKQGGAIYAESINQLVLNSCAFYNSTASDNGGAVYTSVSSAVTKCNFSQTSSPKGAAIYAVLENDINISDITLDITKEEGVSAILVSGGNSSNSLTFGGSGCFISSGKGESDKSADFIDFESEGSLKLEGDMCFSGSFDDSIKLPPGTSVNQQGGWFNCDKCPAPPPPQAWDPSEGLPTNFPTPSYNISATPDVSDKEVTKSKSKLSAGAIAGIVVGVVVFVALVVFLVLFLILRRGRIAQPNPMEIASQEVESVIPSNSPETTSPFWAGDTSTAAFESTGFNTGVNEDPFVKEFEEGY